MGEQSTRMVAGSVFVLFVVAAANLCIASSTDPLYTTGSECNTVRFRAGCFLDVLEKACESKKDLTRCQDNPKSCAEQEEFPVTPEIFPRELSNGVGREGNPVESIWKCCCDATDGRTRFSPYSIGCNDPDQSCMQAIQRHVQPEAEKYKAAFQNCLNDGEPAACADSLSGVTALGYRIQQARAEIVQLQSEECAQLPNKLAAAEPQSECGDFADVAWSRSVERPELYCDTISWQFYEMGSGDQFREHCPHHPHSAAPWLADSASGDEEASGDEAASNEDPNKAAQWLADSGGGQDEM